MKIICVGGGTMGHVNPALSILNYAKKYHKMHCYLITDSKCKNIIKDSENTIEDIFILAITKTPNNIISFIFIIFNYIKCFYSSLIYLNKIKPNYIVGFGGYVSVFPIIAASFLNIFYSIIKFFTNKNLFDCKIIIHEQNKVPGKATILLSYFAYCAALSFVDTINIKSFFCKTHYTGNPIKENIENFAINYNAAKEQDNNTFNILIFAGSQASTILNVKLPDIIFDALFKIKQQNANFNIKISHQSNIATKKLLEEKYKNNNIDAKISNYFEDMALEYKWADLIICRSGASSIFEIIATLKPSILIPLPSAHKNHQLLNAKYLIDNKAGFIVHENNIETELSNLILHILQNNEILINCIENLKKLQNNSTKNLMNLILNN